MFLWKNYFWLHKCVGMTFITQFKTFISGTFITVFALFFVISNEDLKRNGHMSIFHVSSGMLTINTINRKSQAFVTHSDQIQNKNFHVSFRLLIVRLKNILPKTNRNEKKRGTNKLAISHFVTLAFWWHLISEVH